MADRSRFALICLVAALACAGCAEQNGGPDTFVGIAPEDPGPVHVHALGLDPADGSLFIATHTGLYRVDSNKQDAERVTDRYQDTMGFTVVGPNRFLGSGHPDVRDLRSGTPANMGLIESADAGRTWREVSLAGEADFHVLRAHHHAIYGYDSTNMRLLVSIDEGKTWLERPVPGPVLDLVPDPESPGHILLSTDPRAGGGARLYASTDDGQTWRNRGLQTGLLAWPEPASLYTVRPGGEVYWSGDAGGSWTPVGQVGGEPAALLAVSSEELYVALHDGTIKESSDRGATWKVRSTP
jgi:catechol 2,3-dioxygenase-like lactoylglutathione lyase family enzyme